MTRYLCSELVVLKRDAGETVVNLEEIWTSGAAIEMDEAPDAGQAVELKCGEATFPGTVMLAAHHEFGWRAEIEFRAGTTWSPEVFKPGHMLNPAEFMAKKAET